MLDRILEGGTNTVRLELENVDFEVYPNSLTVSIPLDVWEYIRLFSLVSYECADMTDDELYEKAKDGAELSLRWSLKYKTLDELIEGTFESYKELREKLQKQLGSKPEKNPYYRG